MRGRSLLLGVALAGVSCGALSACATPAESEQVSAPPEAPVAVEPEAETSATSPAPRAAVDLPIDRLASGHLIVPFAVGDEELAFVLDSGASTTVITPSTRDRMGIAPDAGQLVQASGANGQLAGVRVVSLPAGRIQDRDYAPLTAAVMDLSHLEDSIERRIDGILGRNFLIQHEVEIDFPAERLRLHDPGAMASGSLDAGGLLATDYGSFPAGLIRIDVRLDGGEAFPAVFDLGAARSVLNWHAARAAGLDPAAAGEQTGPGEELLGADDRPLAARVHRFESIELGALRFDGPTLHVADLAVFETLGVAEGPAMVFGIDLLGDRRVVIDYPGERLLVSPPPAA